VLLCCCAVSLLLLLLFVGESPLLISRLFGLLFWVLIGLNFILLAFAFDYVNLAILFTL
jgi:hypothetical protein